MSYYRLNNDTGKLINNYSCRNSNSQNTRLPIRISPKRTHFGKWYSKPSNYVGDSSNHQRLWWTKVKHENCIKKKKCGEIINVEVIKE